MATFEIQISLMRTLKTLFALIVSVPFMYLPVEWALEGKSENEAVSVMKPLQFDSAVFGESEWMTTDMSAKAEGVYVYDDLLTYSEVEDLKPEGWELPTLEEMTEFLEMLGFNQAPGYIPSEYYQVDWKYSGYVDPILGTVGAGEEMHVWLKDDGINNYIVIDKDELTFTKGHTLPNSQLSARLIRK